MAFEEEKEEASRLVLYLNCDLCLMPVLAVGYARRYFILQSSGILAYSFEPGSQVRDQISLPGAAISSSAKHRDIHVDSSRVTFHIKCLSSQDFEIWMGALRYRSLNNSTCAATKPTRFLEGNSLQVEATTNSMAESLCQRPVRLGRCTMRPSLWMRWLTWVNLCSVASAFEYLNYCRQSMI